METQIQKSESKYLIQTPYTDTEGREQKATVVLLINYSTNNYSITPYCGAIRFGFNFSTTSHKYQMWKAILQSIDKAIDFANNELKI